MAEADRDNTSPDPTSVASPEPASAQFWLTLGLVALVSVVFVRTVQFGANGVLFLMFDTGRFRWIATSGFAAFLGAAVLLLLTHRAPLGGLLRGVSRGAATTLCTYGAVWFVSVLLMEGGSRTAPFYIPQASTLTDSASLLVFGLLAEELVFRGALFELAEEGLSARAAVWVTAVCFGLSHWSYHGFDVTAAAAEQVSYTTAMGFLLGSQRRWSRGLTLPIATHFVINLPLVFVTHLS
jgi:membrane protease YdiL (CAAX protease family)